MNMPSLSSDPLPNGVAKSSGSSQTAEESFDAIIAGTSDKGGVNSLVIDRSLLDEDVHVFIYLTDTELMQKLLAYAKDIIRAKSTDIISSNKESNTNGSSGFKISQYHEREVLEIGATTKDSFVELPLDLAENKYTPILVATSYDKSVDDHKGELRLTQRRIDGELSEGYSIMIGPITDKKDKNG